MAILKEDKHDVKKHLGKALANKVSKVTNDSKMKKFKITSNMDKTLTEGGGRAENFRKTMQRKMKEYNSNK